MDAAADFDASPVALKTLQTLAHPAFWAWNNN
jgi:hypothetical protein